ncbi:MAG: STAS domain-containing protein [Planctomycetota bacterium]
MAVLNFEIKSVSLPSGEEAKAVFLSGSIDASTNQTFEGRLQDILSSGTNKVLLVLTNVKYINSTGLGTIVKCVDTFREQNGDIKLVGVPTKVIALFEMLGLLALFETHETIEEAVASFGAAAEEPEAETPAIQFPIQFKHPYSGMGLNVSQPGRFKDPRSGDYFSVDANGTIEFYEMSKTRIVDVKLPADPQFSQGLIALATSLAGAAGVDAETIPDIQRAVDEICSLIAKNTEDKNQTCNWLLVGEKNRIQIGVVSYSNALNISMDDPAIQIIKQSMSEVKHMVLPTRGYLLALVKNFG